MGESNENNKRIYKKDDVIRLSNMYLLQNSNAVSSIHDFKGLKLRYFESFRDKKALDMNYIMETK